MFLSSSRNADIRNKEFLVLLPELYCTQPQLIADTCAATVDPLNYVRPPLICNIHISTVDPQHSYAGYLGHVRPPLILDNVDPQYICGTTVDPSIHVWSVTIDTQHTCAVTLNPRYTCVATFISNIYT